MRVPDERLDENPIENSEITDVREEAKAKFEFFKAVFIAASTGVFSVFSYFFAHYEEFVRYYENFVRHRDIKTSLLLFMVPMAIVILWIFILFSVVGMRHALKRIRGSSKILRSTRQ
ncbi:hypothetical protein [Helicobacter felistomachi]|uniref:hypothetical protein n=1 Tax=Helicobacter felistomachi TaxID=3040201 RepID=UPI00257416EF|nr:hypothetical protein [Helicobacter sp. NHP21005]